jgi:hypothetical protein
MTVQTIGPRAPAARTPAPVAIERLPLTVNLLLYRGDLFTMVVAVFEPDSDDPADLSGSTAAAQIRIDPDGNLLGEFAVSIDDATSTVILQLDGPMSSSLPRSSVFDCELSPGPVTLIRGTITLDPDVTRDGP